MASQRDKGGMAIDVDECVACVGEALEEGDEAGEILFGESGGGVVEEVEGGIGHPLGELCEEAETLAFTDG